jgi:Flp pilus assembly protein TadB
VKVNRERAQAVNEKLAAEMRELEEILSRGDEAVREVEERARKVEMEKKELDKQVSQSGVHVVVAVVVVAAAVVVVVVIVAAAVLGAAETATSKLTSKATICIAVLYTSIVEYLKA